MHYLFCRQSMSLRWYQDRRGELHSQWKFR